MEAEDLPSLQPTTPAWASLERDTRRTSHCPCPGIQQEPRLARNQRAESREKQAVGPMSERCGKAAAGLQGPVMEVNFFKSAPKAADTEIS